jgi:hypothetical protein
MLRTLHSRVGKTRIASLLSIPESGIGWRLANKGTLDIVTTLKITTTRSIGNRKEACICHSSNRLDTTIVDAGGRSLQTISIRSISSSDVTSKDSNSDCINEETMIHQEASFLTRSLFRACIRSIRLIQEGNSYDEVEFQMREARQLDSMSLDDEKDEEKIQHGRRHERHTGRLAAASTVRTMSFLPPVSRKDDLQSRAMYYTSYAREMIAQEADCLDVFMVSSHFSHHNNHSSRRNARNQKYSILYAQNMFHRYLSLLQQGNYQRKWLLSDMQFTDPIVKLPPSCCSFQDADRLKHLDQLVSRYLADANRKMNHGINHDEEDEAGTDQTLLLANKQPAPMPIGQDQNVSVFNHDDNLEEDTDGEDDMMAELVRKGNHGRQPR